MKNITLLALAIMLAISCSKEPEIPECMQTIIDDYKKDIKDGCPYAYSLKEYIYHDRTVYAFDKGECFLDLGIIIMDADCNELCTLGTVVGLTKCEGEDFFKNAKEVKTLWK